jgi:PKD repeat protein
MKTRVLIVMLLAIFLTFTVTSTPIQAKVQVGEEVQQSFETAHPYIGAKGIVWEQEFHWPNASYIAIHFTNFELAKGDYVEVSSPGGKFVYEYKLKGKKVNDQRESINEFWATHIPGDTAIVRLIGKNKKNGHGFVIDKWARGYEKEYVEAVMAGLEEEASLEAICSADDKEWAKCYLGTDMYNESKAVCRLLIGGTSACTGWLLGSEGHVMTNNHCISTQSSADNTDYEFMAEGATCSTDCSSWGACPGIVEASSGTMIKTSSTLDYTLILLPTNITSTYGYMQFRDTLPTIGERIYIPQHPGAKGKMLAVNSDTDGPYAKVYSTSMTPCMGGPGDIGYYADTEGGSSGSPVLGYTDNLVVALHHCANCPNRGVPIPSIITDLGTNIPNNAIGGSVVNPPVADFTGTPTIVQVGSSVTFTDQSSNTPTSWSWSFPGGTPSSSTVQNPTVTYNTVGTYSVTLTVTNSAGNDTITKTNYITVQQVVITYCTSQGNNQNYEYIAGVQVGSLNNTSGASGYTDYTAMTANLTAGGTAGVSLTPGFVSSSYTEYWKIWIDYNGDGDFVDSGEEVFSGSGSSVVNGSFSVPASASGTVTRMRVSMKYGSAPTSCESFTYGEVEDYTVSITGGTVLPPVAEFTASATTITVGDSISFTDQSTNNPTSWSWSFPGGTPGTSTAQNPTVTYNTAGTYNVSLTVTNSAGNDTETKTNFITVQPQVITYCTASGNNQNYEYIAGVQVANLNNTSGASGYTDYTSLTANLTRGASANLTLTPGFVSSSYTEYWKIWIDYNRDGDFEDAGEEVFAGTGSSVVTGSFVVPSSAVTGNTRMRVIMKYSGYASYCGTFTYGEVEDYTVNIQ